jgi:phosphoribosyl 1,2-cyclic phosphate phosphodiesterase
MNGKMLLLGTGASMGVPVMGCDCPVCLSTLPENKRFRPSAVLRMDQKQFLIDAGPELRVQALKYGIDHLDGVLFTHSHHDHTAGIDDLRAFAFKNKKQLPALLSRETAEDLKIRYHYLFNENLPPSGLATKIQMQLLESTRGEVVFEGLPIRYVTYEQTGMSVNGFIIGTMAYFSDICHYPDTIFEDLKGVKTLIVSALRYTSSQAHFTVDEAVDFAERSGIEKTWLTHISHDLDHEKTNAYLPPSVRMAYDGLQIDL